MKKKLFVLLLLLSTLLLICSGCGADATMPYSSAEYENGDWTFDELVAHFEELGFVHIEKYEFTTYDENKAKINRVAINDKEFNKGDHFTPLIDEVLISATTLIPTLKTDNCPEFKELVEASGSYADKKEQRESFLKAHIGEYLMFDGTIIGWSDEYFWVSVDFSLAIDGSDDAVFSWGNIGLSETKLDGDYHYEKYHAGLIKEGMNVHMIVKIVSNKGDIELEIEKMEIVE